MIDGESVSIEATAPMAKVICNDASYNWECEGENITRVRYRDDVQRLIEDILNGAS